MENEFSKVHFSLGSYFSAIAIAENLSDKQMAEFLGITIRSVKKLYKGQLDINLVTLLKFFPELDDIISETIGDSYVRKFSTKTLPNSSSGFPHKGGKKSKFISSRNR